MAPRTKDKGSHDHLLARACLSTYLVFSGILGPLLVLTTMVTIKDPQSWPAVVLIGFLASCCGLWIRTFRLVVSDGILSYRSLFGGNRAIRLSDIDKAETKLATFDALGPFMQLRITVMPGLAQPPILINMKVFSREDLQALFQILGPKIVRRKISLIGKKGA